MVDTETVLVRPRPGLIIAGISVTGTTIPKSLAIEWLGDRPGNQIVVASPSVESEPVARQPVRKPRTGPTGRRKRRSTRK